MPEAKTADGSNVSSMGESAASSDSLTAGPPPDWFGEAEQVAKSQAALTSKELKHVRSEHRPECRVTFRYPAAHGQLRTKGSVAQVSSNLPLARPLDPTRFAERSPTKLAG